MIHLLSRDLSFNDLTELPSGIFESLTALTLLYVELVLIVQRSWLFRMVIVSRRVFKKKPNKYEKAWILFSTVDSFQLACQVSSSSNVHCLLIV